MKFYSTSSYIHKNSSASIKMSNKIDTNQRDLYFTIVCGLGGIASKISYIIYESVFNNRILGTFLLVEFSKLIYLVSCRKSVTVVLARLYIRKYITKSFGYDDWAASVVCISFESSKYQIKNNLIDSDVLNWRTLRTNQISMLLYSLW